MPSIIAPLVFLAAPAPDGVAAGVIHTKWEVSIWILSLHFAPISLNATFAFSNNTKSCTLQKKRDIPEVSDIVWVLTRSMLDGNVPAVVRGTSWKEYSVLISIPECLVDVLVIGEGAAGRR